MTRTYSHSNGPHAVERDHHVSRQPGDYRGAPKKDGAGKYNWGNPTAQSDELPLARGFADTFMHVEDPAELERIDNAIAGAPTGSQVRTVSAEEFAKEKGVNVEEAREVAREHVSP